MFYRSYGLLLFIIALLVASQGYRDNLPLGCLIAGLILLIDLPLRFIGNIVPWRETDEPLWPIARFRGSHIFLIPTWLVGVAGLLLAAGTFFSPGFHKLLTTPNLFKSKDQKDAPPRPDPPPAPRLEVLIEEVAPFDGSNFRFTVHNQANVKLTQVLKAVRYQSRQGKDDMMSETIGDLEAGEKRPYAFRAVGPLILLTVHVNGLTPDKQRVSVDRGWK